MDQLVQCPVCTLFLHNGMSLEGHLDTHPKDQVIKALCNLSTSKSNYGSRSSTPMHSERSYRSRSRTPATDDRWNAPTSIDNERYWPRCASRVSRSSIVLNNRTTSPDRNDEIVDYNKHDEFVGNSHNSHRKDKQPPPYSSHFNLPGYGLNYTTSEHKEETEVKYSRSAEYNSINSNSSNIFNNPQSASTPYMKIQNNCSGNSQRKQTEVLNIVPSTSKEYTKILPKCNNITVLNNLGSVQYITPGMVVTDSSYIQKSAQNNLIMTANLQTTPTVVQNKSVPATVSSHQLNQLANSTFAPNTTVVTQNSQIIYHGLVHNIEGKTFLPALPMIGQDNITNVAQTSSVYQNVMLLDQFGNTSCMYATPPPALSKPSTAFVQTISEKNDKTLIIEVGPMNKPSVTISEVQTDPKTVQGKTSKSETPPKKEDLPETSIPSKGLKILSNIKVEVPVQHHKNLLNTVVDLTGPIERQYPERAHTPERILPDLDNISVEVIDHSNSLSSDIPTTNTFSVIKNVGNPPTYKDSRVHSERIHENDSSDSCPVPDLICNEKASISPCSELSENNDNAVASPKALSSQSSLEVENKKDKTPPPPLKTYRNNPLLLNNIFVKKSKKVLQIKNAKPLSMPSTSSCNINDVPGPSLVKTEFVTSQVIEKNSRNGKLETISIDQISEDNSNNDVPMDMELESTSESHIEPSKGYSSIDLSRVKDEGNSSNEYASERQLASLEPYDYDEDASREILQMEAAKTKQLVSIMNESYFGESLYAEYWANERSEAKGDAVWGEPSHKDAEFVLPNFIHESYKIAEMGESLVDDPVQSVTSHRHDADDCEPSWPGVYQEAPPSEPYDLLARESWPSDASDVDADDRQENLESESSIIRVCSCTSCGEQFSDPKELRLHRLSEHGHEPYKSIIASGVIKKEERPDDVLAGMQLLESKAMATSMLHEVYDALGEAKPKIEVKLEGKRKRRDYLCPTCKVDQLTDVAFHQHLKIHPLECLTCGKCFFRRPNLALHMKTHLGIKNYKCEVCEKRFLTRQKLLEHQNIHSGRAPVKCNLCEQTFRRYSNMVQHRDRHHFNKKPKIRDYVCQCGEIFHSKAKLNWHKETHDGKPKACPYCSDKFVHTASLTRHVRRSHNAYFKQEDANKNPNVPCPVCKQVYLRSNLKNHLLTHSGKRPFVCVICNKGFTTQWNLKLHRWTHMGRSSKPYKCSLCKGAFIRQSEYISHMNAHKSVRPFTCNYCGCQFIRKYNCQRHVREHELAKKYVCKVPDCGKTFHRSYYLSEHMKVHSGARPFACTICGKTSSNKSNHNKHIKIHHAREPVATEA